MAKISQKNIAEAIYEATKGKSGKELDSALKRSVKLISNKRLLGQSTEILNSLQDIIDRKNNIVRMKVITGKPMRSEEKRKLEKEMGEKYKASKIVSEFFERPELLGGIRLEVRDEVLDNTYKNKLDKLEKFLTQGK